MLAHEFVTTLYDKLGDAYDPKRPLKGATPNVGADWTAWMTERLHEVARQGGLSCLCHGNGHRPDLTGEAPGQIRGIQRERLYDLTWYAAWRAYELPDVIIEHENNYGWAPFLGDHWKLMFGWAPLRVSLGYARNASELDGYAKALNQQAMEAGWSFPPRCEDLSLLGHRGMLPRGFRVLYRGMGEDSWRDLGSLAGASERIRPLSA